ncbi:Hypothetical predicted protein [Mytilus galloprovincialis]|uniref:Uncharacterized protein n=1 Tax=Mytilus galloprovincialis TaxID=29158 RepID=A0A8B6EJT0_MYTGA|nr:Hypothetical predicted protein [Mytilus galloprovincialis]
MLVLTGMNYENKPTLYDEAKRSLKKIKGEMCDSDKISASIGSIKLEPAFLAENEEALAAAGYSRNRQKTFHYNGKGDLSRGRGNFYRGFNKSQSGGQTHWTKGGSSTVKKSINPKGSDGTLLTCSSCGFFQHMMANVPHRWENMQERVNITEEEEEVMFPGNVREDITRLGMDARNCAVLDSACRSTEDGNKVFKFGGGTRLKSIGEYSLPAVIAGKDVTTDVVDSDIPLLLSRTAMKKAGVKMDLENDTAEIFGQHISLNLTSSGHYCIPIDKTEEIPVADVCAVRLEELDSKKRYATLLKLHRQFAHPPMKRLIALLKDAGVWKEEYEQELLTIEEQCEICKRYAKTPPRPVVSLPMASQFNEKVAMDLNKMDGGFCT